MGKCKRCGIDMTNMEKAHVENSLMCDKFYINTLQYQNNCLYIQNKHLQEALDDIKEYYDLVKKSEILAVYTESLKRQEGTPEATFYDMGCFELKVPSDESDKYFPATVIVVRGGRT